MYIYIYIYIYIYVSGITNDFCAFWPQLVRADVARVGCATTVCPLLAVDGPSSEGELVFACHYSPR